MSCFDNDALWDLYDSQVLVGDPIEQEQHATTEESSTDDMIIQKVRIDPTLTLSLHVPCALLEDGCLAEVGNKVWDCAVVLARYFRSLMHPHPAVQQSSPEATDAKPMDCWDWMSLDHIVELGSGLGPLGFALFHMLNESNETTRQADNAILHEKEVKRKKLTLTDCVPDLVRAMKTTATEEKNKAKLAEKSSLVDLNIRQLDWSNSEDPLDWIEEEGEESLLIVASEVVYEPCHANMLAGCIERILEKSAKMRRTRLLISNFSERPGWSSFCQTMRAMMEKEQRSCGKRRISVSIDDFNLGTGGYETIVINLVNEQRKRQQL